MKGGYRVMDCDVHVIEPMTMWSERIDPQFRGREPQPEDLAFGMLVDGTPINTWDARERDLDDAARAMRKERILGIYQEMYPDAVARGFDAPSQLDGMDQEGIDLAVLYPSFGLFALATDGLDPALALAISRAYNDWLHEFCATDPARLKGVAMVPRQDPAGAAAEARRAVDELGFVGVFVRPNTVDGHTLDDHCYDPLYAACQELGVPLGLHEGGKAGHIQAGADRFTDLEMQHICTHPLEQMCAAVALIYGGVLDRFPSLDVVFLEAGCGWVPFWLERMDEHHENNLARNFGGTRTRELRPSEYFRRQCYVSANADETFLRSVIDQIGADRIVFSSDYPHPDAPFPHAVDELLALEDLTDDQKRMILWDNTARLYHLDGASAGRVSEFAALVPMNQGMRTVWVWRRWTRWPLSPAILVVASGVIALDVVAAWRDWSIGELGPVAMSPALPLGLVLAWMVGWRRLGLDRENLRAWREFLVVTGGVLVLGGWAYVSQLGSIDEVLGLVLGALDEELVYRLAVLIVIGAGCAALLGRSWRNPEDWGLGPGVVAMFGSGLVFALLPGHVAQMHDALGAVPFMSLGVVLAYAVLRTGALFPAVVVHASLNLVTIYAFIDGVPDVWRISFAACALVALVAGTVVAGLRLGMLRPVPINAWREQMMRPESPTPSA